MKAMKFLKNIFKIIFVVSLSSTATIFGQNIVNVNDSIIYNGVDNTYAINGKGQIIVSFSYKANKNRLLSASLHNSEGEWLAGGAITVNKGEGNSDIALGYSKKAISPGENYEIRYHIRKVGEKYTWRDAIYKGVEKEINVKE